MQTLKMLTAAITFATFGAAGTAFAQTPETVQSTGQGSATDVSTTQTNDKNSRSEAVDTAKPDYARDTHTSAYKKTYPDEAPVMGEELSPDQLNELTPSDKQWEEKYKVWDKDKSGSLGEAEFKAGFSVDAIYSEWDANGDGKLTKDEFNQGLYSAYDQDNNDQWNKEEFNLFKDDAGEGGWLDI